MEIVQSSIWMAIEIVEGKEDGSGKNMSSKWKPIKLCSFFKRWVMTDWELQPSLLLFLLIFCFALSRRLQPKFLLTRITVRTTKLHECHAAEATHKLSSSITGIFLSHLMKPPLPACYSHCLLIFPPRHFLWWCDATVWSTQTPQVNSIQLGRKEKDNVSWFVKPGLHHDERRKAPVRAQKWLKKIKSRNQGKRSQWWKIRGLCPWL